MSQSNQSSSGSRKPIPYDEEYNHTVDIQSISPSAESPGVDIPSSYRSEQTIKHRRPSLSHSFDQIRHAGGVNSIDAFARSWTRAAGYFKISPSRQTFVSEESNRDEEDAESCGEASVCEEDLEPVPSEYASLCPTFSRSNYGSTQSFSRVVMPPEGLSDSVTRHAVDPFSEQQQANQGGSPTDKERQPLLVKTVATDQGRVQKIIVGQSTLPQTVFNSVNILIGVGVLSLPLGLKYSGCLPGLLFITYAAAITNHTAKLLAKCMDRSPNKALVTYSDIAYIAYGQKSRVCVSILFSIELLAACVALVVLFADSLNALIPSIDVLTWKILSGLILTPLSFLPLRVLSFSSILGILSTVSIFLIILGNGLLKMEAPGSLYEPQTIYMFPKTWMTLPLSLGLLMSPWGGHGVFPNIYKDMRHPEKYSKAVNITYWFTYPLDTIMMVVGLLMFGDNIHEEVTANILELKGYPEGSKIAMVILIAIIPLTKTPLSARPLFSTFEGLMGVGSYDSELANLTIKAIVRILMNVVFVAVAILFPAFDRIMAFLGSALCFTICVIFPLMFYLKIFGNELSMKRRAVYWVVIVISSIMATIGTVFTFIPKEKWDS